MGEISYAQAVHDAMREEMLRDPKVLLIGEEVGRVGGVFRVTTGLIEEFGEERVRNTPISEGAIVGVSIGAAALGFRPVAEIMFADLLPLCMEQIVNQAAKMRYMSGAQVKLPLVIRSPQGAYSRTAAQHSQSLDSWFIHVPGLKVAIPSTPYDVKGLIKTAIRDDNPVVFFEHKSLYQMKGTVPDNEYLIPFGQADVKRAGEDVTIVATSLMVHRSLEAAAELSKIGISAEVVDLRTLAPLDRNSILESVKKTGKLVIVEEACKTGGLGAEIAAIVAENGFDYLDAPILRVAAQDIPIPFSAPMEDYVLPNTTTIVERTKALIR